MKAGVGGEVRWGGLEWWEFTASVGIPSSAPRNPREKGERNNRRLFEKSFLTFSSAVEPFLPEFAKPLDSLPLFCVRSPAAGAPTAKWLGPGRRKTTTLSGQAATGWVGRKRATPATGPTTGPSVVAGGRPTPSEKTRCPGDDSRRDEQKPPRRDGCYRTLCSRTPQRGFGGRGRDRRR